MNFEWFFLFVSWIGEVISAPIRTSTSSSSTWWISLPGFDLHLFLVLVLQVVLCAISVVVDRWIIRREETPGCHNCRNTGAETHQSRLKRYAEDARKEGVEFTEFSTRCGFCLSTQALKSIENWKKEVKEERRKLKGLEKLKPDLREANIKLRAAERKLEDIENITRGTEERLQGEERGSEKWMELLTQAMNNIREVLHNPVPATTLTEYFEMGLVVLAIAGLAMKQFKKERSDCIWTNLGVALSSIGFPSGSEAVCVIYSFLLRKSSKTWRNGAMWSFIGAFLVLSGFSSDPSDPSLDNYMAFVFGIFMTDVLIFKLGKFRHATNIASGLLLLFIAAVSVDATYWHLLENIPLSVFNYGFRSIACAAAILSVFPLV